MNKIKEYWNILTNLEKECILVSFSLIIIFSMILHDSKIAVFNAFLGIMYTTLAGKGKIDCFYFGICGSALYAFLSFRNALWGNMFLYLLYYIPMQFLGLINWGKNLNKSNKTVIKSKLNNSERFYYGVITFLISVFTIYILNIAGDKSPIFDGITAIFSVTGMILTVKRKMEQWVLWMIVAGNLSPRRTHRL